MHDKIISVNFTFFQIEPSDCTIMKLLIILVLATSVRSFDGKPIKPKKVAILGGGPASCATALALTDQPGWKERYDITIYQLGWRLEGKARSGRNKKYGQRSEGITGHHLGASSYLETKRLMQSVYDELKRPEEVPLRTFEEAFKLKPFWAGTGTECEVDTKCFSAEYLFQKLVETFLWMTEKMIKDLRINYNIKKEHFNPNSSFLKSQVASVQALVRRTFFISEKSLATQELLLVIDTAAAVIIGFMEDNLIEKGLHTINHLDFRQWLKKAWC